MTKGMLKQLLADNPLPDSVNVFISFEGDPADMLAPREIHYTRDKRAGVHYSDVDSPKSAIGLLFY